MQYLVSEVYLHTIIQIQNWLCTAVADPGFPRVGANLKEECQPTIWQIFLKTARKWRKFGSDWVGGRVSCSLSKIRQHCERDWTFCSTFGFTSIQHSSYSLVKCIGEVLKSIFLMFYCNPIYFIFLLKNTIRQWVQYRSGRSCWLLLADEPWRLSFR